MRCADFVTHLILFVFMQLGAKTFRCYYYYCCCCYYYYYYCCCCCYYYFQYIIIIVISIIIIIIIIVISIIIIIIIIIIIVIMIIAEGRLRAASERMRVVTTRLAGHHVGPIVAVLLSLCLVHNCCFIVKIICFIVIFVKL